MNSEKMTFYDSEIFDYGMKSGFFYKWKYLSSFSFDYRFIPALFSSYSQSLSIFRYLNTGEADLIHIIYINSEIWCFSIINNKGIFEKPNEQRLKELLNF